MPDILSRLEQHVLTFPDKTFVHFYDEEQIHSISYGEIWARSQNYAARLAGFGLPPKSIVIIMLRHTPDLYAAFLGAMMCGAIPSFMPPPTPKQRADIFWPAHQKLFDEIDPCAFITPGDLQPLLSSILRKAPIFVDPEMVEHGTSFRFSCVTPDSVAFLQHSSGTTGTKKGVMLSHRAVMAQVASYASKIDLDRNSLIASWLPLYHDMGLIACFMTPLITGATVSHMDAVEWASNPLKIIEIIERDRATHNWMPNFAFNHIAMSRRPTKRDGRDLSSLVAMINCSEPCKRESMALFERTFADCGLAEHVVQTCYAMAENVFAVSQSELGKEVRTLCAETEALLKGAYRPCRQEDNHRTLVSCGKIIEGVEVSVFSVDAQPIGDGEIGEICIRGDSLFDGYNQLPKLSETKIQDGWYHTGDMGFLWEEELYVVGRTDDLIIVRGRNYYAHDIEAIVNTVPGIKPGRCVVFPRENQATGTTDAICLAETNGTVDQTELRREAKRAVEAQSGLVLAKLEIFPEGTLIKTTSGKISRERNASLLDSK